MYIVSVLGANEVGNKYESGNESNSFPTDFEWRHGNEMKIDHLFTSKPQERIAGETASSRNVPRISGMDQYYLRTTCALTGVHKNSNETYEYIGIHACMYIHNKSTFLLHNFFLCRQLTLSVEVIVFFFSMDFFTPNTCLFSVKKKFHSFHLYLIHWECFFESVSALTWTY